MSPKPLAILGAATLLTLYAPRVPYSWTHTLTSGCYWRETASVGLLDAVEPSAGDVEAQDRCFALRGLASRSPVVRIIGTKWPTAAQLTAWRTEHETNQGALPAEGYAPNLPLVTRR